MTPDEELRVCVDALRRAAFLCDRLALGVPDNRHKDNPRAAYQAGAAKCAWEIRQLMKEVVDKSAPAFDHVEPKLQECPDCHAEPGEPCVVPADDKGPKGPSYVHIRRCFTPASNKAIEAHYTGKR